MKTIALREERNIVKISRRGIIALLLILCLACLFFVGINAQSSKVQYDINQINKAISETEKQITKLQVKIKTGANIANIEKRALELGMIYPSNSQMVFVTGGSDIQEFALALMESVY